MKTEITTVVECVTTWHGSPHGVLDYIDRGWNWQDEQRRQIGVELTDVPEPGWYYPAWIDTGESFSGAEFGVAFDLIDPDDLRARSTFR